VDEERANDEKIDDPYMDEIICPEEPLGFEILDLLGFNLATQLLEVGLQKASRHPFPIRAGFPLPRCKNLQMVKGGNVTTPIKPPTFPAVFSQ
jgi:hypothetical protein